MNTSITLRKAVIALAISMVVQALPQGQSSNATDNKVLYFTFDDGPADPATIQLLDVLDTHNAKATFFVIGSELRAYPDVVIDAAARGHSIQNHTNTHPRLTTLSDSQVISELDITSNLIESLVGVSPNCTRPPYRDTDERVKGLIESQGMEEILWDVDADDWLQPGVDEIVSEIIANTDPGDVILLHDGPTIASRGQTIEATDILLSHYADLGYRFEAIPACNPTSPPSDNEIVVKAAGQTGEELLQLSIDGTVVKTFALDQASNFWGSPTWGSYAYQHSGPVDTSNIRLTFVNDGVTAGGGDRNLRVDHISIDGSIYQTEDPTVISTGSYGNGSQCDTGTFQTDNLVCNGYFEFPINTPPGSNNEIVVKAAGQTGEELLQLSIDGTVVKTFALDQASNFWGSPTWGSYVYQHSGPVGTSNIRLTFVNDGVTAGGGDRNLRVDHISIDGSIYQTEDPTVISTGSYGNGSQCDTGTFQTDNLVCNGYFEYSL